MQGHALHALDGLSRSQRLPLSEAFTNSRYAVRRHDEPDEYSGLREIIREKDDAIAHLKLESAELRRQLHALQAPATERLTRAYEWNDPLWLYDASGALPVAEQRYMDAYTRIREAITWGRPLLANDVATVLNGLAAYRERRENARLEENARLSQEVSRLTRSLSDTARQRDDAVRERDLAAERLSQAIAGRTGFARVLDDDE